MSAPLIWMGIPGLTSLILWFLRKKERLSLISGLAVSFFLIIFSYLTPIGKPILKVGTFIFQITPSIEILGRNFTLTKGDLIFVSFIQIVLFIFLCMSLIIEIPEKFTSISFLITTIVTGALSVQPFLYAALLLEIAVLLSIILLAKGGETPSTGVVRFLIFQTMAMPVMLAAGWVLSAVEANPSEPALILQALGLIGLGFIFWLAIFPFNFWMPQLAGEKSPFLVGFFLILFNSAILVLIMRFLDGFVWLRDDTRIFIVLRYLGILMISSGALLFITEKNRKKTLAYLISFQTGTALLALSLNQTIGWQIFTMMFIPRIVSIFGWSSSLAFLDEIESSEESQIEGFRVPSYVRLTFWISGLTIIGFPLTSGFFYHLELLRVLANQDLFSFWGLVISIILLGIGVVKFIRELGPPIISEKLAIMSKLEKGFFIAITGVLCTLGFFSQPLLNGLLVMLQAFPNLK